MLIAAGIVAMAVSGCDRLSVKDSMDDDEYPLLDQKNNQITFPEEFSGNVMLVGYVYTHCPDICPVITYNMRDVQRQLEDEDDFMLVSISFDPERDTPEILHQYAENYKINQENWRFLTGEKSNVDDLLEKLGIATVKSPTRFDENNTPIYFIDHTDRVTLVDREGNIRMHYNGSELNSDEAIEDIRQLLRNS